MDILRTERPKIEFSKLYKSSLPWISAFITVLTFVLSGQRLTVWSAVIAVIIIVVLACLIYLILYVIRYIKYLLETERNHHRLMQLYGEKESELVERDRIISAYPRQLLDNFRWGGLKTLEAVSNEALSDLSKKDIEILEKVAGDSGVELIFNAGESEGIRKEMFLSVVTAYGDDLWGIVRIVWVDKNKCRGEVVSKINLDFWRRMEKEMYSDASPPSHLKARLYTLKDLDTELRLMKRKLEEKG